MTAAIYIGIGMLITLGIMKLNKVAFQVDQLEMQTKVSNIDPLPIEFKELIEKEAFLKNTLGIELFFTEKEKYFFKRGTKYVDVDSKFKGFYVIYFATTYPSKAMAIEEAYKQYHLQKETKA